MFHKIILVLIIWLKTSDFLSQQINEFTNKIYLLRFMLMEAVFFGTQFHVLLYLRHNTNLMTDWRIQAAIFNIYNLMLLLVFLIKSWQYDD